MNIFRTILSEVTGTDYAKTEAGSIEQLVRKITDFLEGKRYTFCTMSTSLIVMQITLRDGYLRANH
jgi:hypothetical protein